MSNAFNSQILEEKLSKLNNSQQSIESILMRIFWSCVAIYVL